MWFLFNVQNKILYDRFISIAHKVRFYNERFLFTSFWPIVKLANQ